MAEPLNPDVVWALDDVRSRREALARRRDYYEGRHLPVLPDAQTLSPLLQQLLTDLADNLCDDVVDEPVDRMAITSWGAPADSPTADQADAAATGSNRGALAQELWDLNRGASREARTYREAWMLGDAYNIVDLDRAGKPRWYPQRPEQMAVRYSTENPDVIEVAAKVWKDGKRYRLNLYYGPRPDQEGPGGRLERYATKGSSTDGGLPLPAAFQPLVLENPDGTDDDGTRAKWTRCPVFHFPADEVGGYGRSALTDVIPLQDVLNKSLADLITDMEDAALPQRYAIGVQPEYDPITGAEKPLRRRSRRASEMLRVGAGADKVQMGQFDAVDLTQFLAVQDSLRAEIARKGHLPPYSVDRDGGGTVSGLRLLIEDGRLVKRVKRAQRDWEWVWCEQLAYMLTLAGTPTDADEIAPEWAPPETRDEVALWELAALKAERGVPDRVLLIEGGYDPDEVDKWLEEADTQEGGRLSPPGAGIMGVPFPGPAAGAPPLAPPPPAGAATPARQQA